MHDENRRLWLMTVAAGAAALALPAGARAAMAPGDKFDLLLRNANVLDPSQNLSGLRDIGMRYGQIEAIEAGIAPDRAGSRAARDGRSRQAGHAGADRSACPHLRFRLGHRHPG